MKRIVNVIKEIQPFQNLTKAKILKIALFCFGILEIRALLELVWFISYLEGI
jgi:hypothetical protein